MKESRDIHIACILNNPKNTYWALCGQGLQDQAHDAGTNLTIRPVYTFAAAQSAFLDTLRQPPVDAIIVAGTDCSIPDDGASAAPRLPVIVCSGQLLGARPACDLIPDLRRAADLATSVGQECEGPRCRLLWVSSRRFKRRLRGC